VARYRRRGDTFHFAEVVVTTKQIGGMVHPFDVEFGDDGRLYVSCQDTNTVLAILPKTRKPAPVASHLRKSFPNGNFLPGTLVASSLGRLPEAGDHPPLDVPPPQGLKVVLDLHGKPRHSVRGIIVHRKHLYVAGEAGNVVKVYDLRTGRLVARVQAKKLAKPVHLILHGDTLYIGAAGTGSILAYDIPKVAPRGKLKARVVIDGKLRAPSGFAIGPDGDLYVAERFDQRVRRFSVKGKKKGTFIDGLPDMPEFLVHVPDRA
jgi:DNA-binding beta-propeller fold protein YncE